MDGAWAAVGAVSDNVFGGNFDGSVYMMESSGGWQIRQKLLHPDVLDISAGFGTAISLSADVVAVGAPGAASDRSGAVFIYRRSGQTWSYEAKLRPLDPIAGEQFGFAVAVQGNQLIVGAPGSAAESKGRAFVFEKASDGGWQFKQQLEGTSLTSYSRFGTAVALRDGVALVGAPGSNWVSMPGRVFEFLRSGNNWSAGATITAANNISDEFGTAVALAGGRALVGAPKGITTHAGRRGTAYIYSVSAQGWTLLRKLEEPRADVQSGFGACVALSPTSAVIASKLGSFAFGGQGAVEVRISAAAPGSWPVSQLTGPGGRVRQGFGSAVAVQDGAALVGGAGADEVIAYAGNPLVATATLKAPRGRRQYDSGFGSSISMSGNLTIAGAPEYDSAVHANVGCAYLFERVMGRWQLAKIFESPAQVAGARYGFQVAVDGDIIAVSATGIDHDTGNGRIYLYRRRNGQWPDTPDISIDPAGTHAANGFGSGMALEGNRLAAIHFLHGAVTQAVITVCDFQAGSVTVRRERRETVSPDSITMGCVLKLQGDEVKLSDPGQNRAIAYSISATEVARTSVMLGRRDSYSLGGLMDADGSFVAMAASVQPPGQPLSWPLVFAKKGNSWHQTAAVPPQLRDGVLDYCQGLALRGDLLLIAGASSDYLFVRRANGWQAVRILLPVGSQHRLPSYKATICLSADTAAIATRDSSAAVSFYSLAAFQFSDGPATPEYSVGDGGQLNLGEFLVGKKVRLPLTVKNHGGTQVALNRGTVTWDSTLHSFEAVEMPDGIIHPGASAQVMVEITPPAAGTYSATLHLGSDDSSLAQLTVSLSHTAVNTATAPLEAPLHGPVLARLGYACLLQPQILGTRVYSCQWMKDGRDLPGATERSLYIDSTQAEHAGSYRLKIASEAGNLVTSEILVGVYDPLVGTIKVQWNEPVTATAKVWGPVEVRWNLDRESAIFRGTKTPTLTITRGEAVPFPIAAQVVLGDKTASVVELVPELGGVPLLIFNSPGLATLPLGEPIHTLYVLDNFPGPDTVFSARNLPPGLTLGSDGSIYGTPTKAGHYSVIFFGRNSYGAAEPVVWNVTVVPPESRGFGPAASYASLIHTEARVPNAPVPVLGGLINARVEARGGVTGQIRLGPRRYLFATVLRSRSDEPAETRKAEIRLPPVAGSMSTTLVVAQTTTLGEGSTFSAYLNLAVPEGEVQWTADTTGPVIQHISIPAFPVKYSAQRISDATGYWQDSRILPGRYNALLDADVDVPIGTGFMSITISNALQASGIGKLADGRTVTFSSPLVITEDHFPAMLLACSERPGDMLLGRIVADSLYYPPVPEVPLSGKLAWSRAPLARSRVYPGGFVDMQLNVSGAPHFVAKATLGPLSGLKPAPGDSMLTLAGGGLPLFGVESPWETLFTLMPAGAWAFPSPNASDMQIRLNAATGQFTGSFLLQEPNAPGTGRRASRRVEYTGILIPGLQRGGGFFVIPPSPGSEVVVPEVTGKVSVNLSDD
jgi:hypothetical protein